MSKICAALYAEGLLDRRTHTGVARRRTAGGEAEAAWIALVGAETMATVRGALAAYAHSGEQRLSPNPVRIRFS